MVAEEVFCKFLQKYTIFKVSYNLSGAKAGARAAMGICGSEEPKEIFSAPQNWFPV
jgi:hypothetical protein